MEVVARELRTWRDRRNISAQQLAERCSELGYAIPRNVIANIESGRRNAITVPELIILAMALNVPPILLVYPVGVDYLVEIAPDKEIAPWFATRWFMADARPPAELLGGRPDLDIATGMREWEQAATVIPMYRRHDSLIRRYRFVRDDTMAELRRLAEPRPPEQGEATKAELQSRTDMLARDVAKAAEALYRHRETIRELGYRLPDLPSDISLD